MIYHNLFCFSVKRKCGKLKNQYFATHCHIKDGKLNFIAVFANKSIGNHYRKTGQITISLNRLQIEVEEGHFSWAEKVHKQNVNIPWVQFIDCISRISQIFQKFGVLCSLKTEETLHPCWLSDIRHDIKYQSYQSISNALSFFFLHIPDILFSSTPWTESKWIRAFNHQY